MTLGDRIRRARLARNLTLEALGEKLGVSRQLVHQWETNRTSPANHIASLCEILEQPSAYFYDEKPSANGLNSKIARLSSAQRHVIEATIDAMLIQHPEPARKKAVK
jgi:transcriptional regulator with XRE-family HTH domain